MDECKPLAAGFQNTGQVRPAGHSADLLLRTSASPECLVWHREVNSEEEEGEGEMEEVEEEEDGEEEMEEVEGEEEEDGGEDGEEEDEDEEEQNKQEAETEWEGKEGKVRPAGHSNDLLLRTGAAQGLKCP